VIDDGCREAARQAEADAAHVVDERRAGRPRLELAPQVAQVDVDDVLVTEP